MIISKLSVELVNVPYIKNFVTNSYESIPEKNKLLL